MAKQNKSVWNEVNTEKEPDIYKIIKGENLDNLINDEFDLEEEDFEYILGFDDEY